MDTKNIGKNLRELRKSARLTQNQLAEKSNLSANYIAHIEGGRNPLSIESLLNLCNALNVTPNAILLGEYKAKGAADSLLRKTDKFTDSEFALVEDIIDAVSKTKNASGG